MKSKSKFEIAQAAGISTEVLRRWIMERRKEISALAVKIFKYKWKSRATLTGGPAKHQLTKHFSTMRNFTIRCPRCLRQSYPHDRAERLQMMYSPEFR